MAVSWKCVEALPGELEKTLKDLTDERWRVLSVVSAGQTEIFTVVSYKMQYEKGSRRRDDDYDPEPTQ